MISQIFRYFLQFLHFVQFGAKKSHIFLSSNTEIQLRSITAKLFARILPTFKEIGKTLKSIRASNKNIIKMLQCCRREKYNDPIIFFKCHRYYIEENWRCDHVLGDHYIIYLEMTILISCWGYDIIFVRIKINENKNLKRIIIFNWSISQIFYSIFLYAIYLTSLATRLTCFMFPRCSSFPFVWIPSKWLTREMFAQHETFLFCVVF